MKIIGITTTYNVSEKIPYVMPYYERMEIDKLIVYDNGSTDNTIELLSRYPFIEIRYFDTNNSFDDNAILEIKNTVWRDYIDEYDWCIVCDFDEVLYSKRNFKEVLQEKSMEGKTYLDKIALNLISRTFPTIDDGLIHEKIDYGSIWDCDDFFIKDENGIIERNNKFELCGVYGNKIILFDIKKTDIIYTTIGGHECKFNSKNNFSFDDDISFFHLKYIDFDYILKNSKEYGDRIVGSTRYDYLLNNLNICYEYCENKRINTQYYVESPGNIFYPNMLLLAYDISSTFNGIDILTDISKKYNDSLFYHITVFFFTNTNNIIDWDNLYYYGIDCKVNVIGFAGDAESDIYSALASMYDNFNRCMIKNPWTIINDYSIIDMLSDKDLSFLLEKNKLSETVIYDNITLTRFNTIFNKKCPTLGCYLIVKNEEFYIKDCVENLLRVCDEIVVVDTGSTDKTKNILQEYSQVKLYDFEWIHDFSAARNYALSLTKSDYVFSIDADEYLTDDLIDYLLSLKKDNFQGYNSINLYIKVREDWNYLGGRTIVKNNGNCVWKYKIHEKLYYDESNNLNVDTSNGLIIHKPQDSKTNYGKYAEVYFNEINSTDVLNKDKTGHYFYYLFYTLQDIDIIVAYMYLYNIYMTKNFLMSDENSGCQLLSDGYISQEMFMVNTMIGGYQNECMVLPCVDIVSDSNAKLCGLLWCYNNGSILSEHHGLDLAIMLYNNGFFKLFIEITQKLYDQYPNSEIVQHNMSFIRDTLLKIKQYKLVIDCSDGYECLPSTVYYMSQYFDDVVINCKSDDDIVQIKQRYSLKPFDKFEFVKNQLPQNDSMTVNIKANIQHSRMDLKRNIEQLMYGD